ncbi:MULTISPECIES: hypothetical protein [Brevibacterium]|mgnify:CR=1 FL=1|jgi:hypothetical protein|uniref:SPOR domain-containing protein n=1 Tax=Brevibacterium salitolerans TaxID=1403566 RepID=A0ABP5ISJ3_9MICO|nr:hypothetical protein [Brevibacterium sp.]
MVGESQSNDVQYWYNTRTHEVEKGPQSSWQFRMGPYATEAEARAALERARERSADWDAEDRSWEEG